MIAVTRTSALDDKTLAVPDRPGKSSGRHLDVEEAFFHCSKCIVRSNLWTPQAWPELDGLPSLAQTMVDAAALPMPVDALQAIITQDEAERLY
jgi:hypothetical protein